MSVMRVCVDGISFSAAHYTPVGGVPQLHGHTFTVSVCVEGELGEGLVVMDFLKLREIVAGLVSKFEYALIVPKKDVEALDIGGPFRVKLAVLEYDHATAEAISMSLCDELITVFKSLNKRFKVDVRVLEGKDSYAETSCTA